MADVVIGKGYMRSCGRGGGGPGKEEFFFLSFLKSFYWVGSWSVFRSGSRVSDREGGGV